MLSRSRLKIISCRNKLPETYDLRKLHLVDETNLMNTKKRTLVLPYKRTFCIAKVDISSPGPAIFTKRGPGKNKFDAINPAILGKAFYSEGINSP